jgi:hypothetical protein
MGIVTNMLENIGKENNTIGRRQGAILYKMKLKQCQYPKNRC